MAQNVGVRYLGIAIPIDKTILDRVLGARAAGVHYRLFSVWTLVPARLDQQLSDHSTVDENASGAVDCRLSYTMANCPQSRLEKPGERREKREREKEGKRARKRQGLVFLGSGEENPRVLLGDADQESETRMSKNALRTGRRQAVEYNHKNQNLVSFPDNIPSAIRLIPHGPNIPVSLPPT
ncbi:hypothetical protein TNCV_4714321 [Trichonephila clavipes]|nr:hypothetical protein TNCV_4714321 [Trichonephila clavipes]